MEIIDSRFKDFRFTLADVVADNTSAARHTISTYRVDAKKLDLRTLGVVFEKNGEVVSTAAGAFSYTAGVGPAHQGRHLASAQRHQQRHRHGEPGAGGCGRGLRGL